MRIGANYLGEGRCEFVVWSPFLKKVTLKLVSPAQQLIPMERDREGYWSTVAENVLPGTRYLYELENGAETTDKAAGSAPEELQSAPGGKVDSSPSSLIKKDSPDPASHWQPQGVHEYSQVVDHSAFNWEDEKWRGLPLSEMIIYELHTGTFTPEGNLEAVIPRLEELKDLGLNALELMPVTQFPGERNWGYDGVYPFAVQNSYGGPEGLKKLVNACHKMGIAVILDVVYNHLGPEGNYFQDFGPYFTGKYKTPWGKAINFDGAYSYGVRNFFIQNALHWFKNYHLDALRLDAVHAIFDMSARPFLQELAEMVEVFSIRERRKFYLMAESDLNDSKIIRPRELGGYGIDAQWCEDFHHALHVLLTGEDQGYYIDFGKTEHLVKSIREGYVYSGQYSEYRKRSHGNPSRERPAYQFILFSQNHDQVGNRMFGERLSSLVSFEGLKLAAGVVLLSPYIPLLFMGEEYGEEAPFLYFISYLDPDLIEAVRKGRREEFKSFIWKNEPPDPQSQDTFLQSKICWEKKNDGKYKIMLNFYKNLIQWRKKIPALSNLNKDSLEVCGFETKKNIFMRRWKTEANSHVFSIFNFNKKDVKLQPPLPGGIWEKVLDSSEFQWIGPGTFLPERLTAVDEITIRAYGFALYMETGS